MQPVDQLAQHNQQLLLVLRVLLLKLSPLLALCAVLRPQAAPALLQALDALLELHAVGLVQPSQHAEGDHDLPRLQGGVAAKLQRQRIKAEGRTRGNTSTHKS